MAVFSPGVAVVAETVNATDCPGGIAFAIGESGAMLIPGGTLVNVSCGVPL